MTTTLAPSGRVPSGSDARLGRLAAQRVLAAIVVIATALAAGAFVYVAFRRISHPYELEWMEGGVLDEVGRVLHGRQLYTRPSMASTPYLYPPLFTWVGAGVAKVFGLNLPALRAVSVVATCGVGAALFGLVRYETRDRIAALLTVGCFLAVYRVGGAWFDVARVDMLFLALLFAGLLLIRVARSVPVACAAAIVLVLAALTKQTAVLPALAVIPFAVLRGRRSGIAYAVAFAGVGVAAALVLQIATHGWFVFYVWTVPSSHDIAREAVVGFWTHDLAAVMWPALGLGAIGLVMLFRRRAVPALLFHLPVFAALVLAAYTARLHTGGWDNVLLPAYAGVAVLAGLGIAELRRRATPAPMVLLAAALVVTQFVLLRYSPTAQIPTAADTRAGDRVVATLRALPAPVYAPGEPWLLLPAHHSDDVTAQAAALQDVLRANVGAPSRRLERDIEQAIHSQAFCAVVVPRPAAFDALPADFSRYYRPGPLLLRGNELRPVTGLAIVPWRVWLPRNPASCRAEPSLRGILVHR